MAYENFRISELEYRSGENILKSKYEREREFSKASEQHQATDSRSDMSNQNYYKGNHTWVYHNGFAKKRNMTINL